MTSITPLIDNARKSEKIFPYPFELMFKTKHPFLWKYIFHNLLSFLVLPHNSLFLNLAFFSAYTMKNIIKNM